MSLYEERRLFRKLEGLWARGEGRLNRLTTPTFNPLYHLGTLSIFFLLVLSLTGVYLTVFYRPGAARAYDSVAGISASWPGSWIRTLHRYAADGLVVTIFLHALKMFLGDRVSGSRWLSWVSGWGLTVLVWSIGLMGYWLVWDQRAQWMTDYGIGLVKGPAALTFASPEALSGAFAFFVIILFLHVFLSILILLGVLLHVMRLSRVRLLAPRWLMVETVIVLLVLAFWRPVASALPADVSRLVGTVTLDGWYLGFLPLAVRWGGLLFWGSALLLLLLLAALPWLRRSQTVGPAVMADALCNGCALCFQECPYGAIEMRPRSDDSRFKSVAVVNPALCTGCGLCVGTCAPAGIELAGLPTTAVRSQLRESLAAACAASRSSVVVFACQRHTALGTLSGLKSEPALVESAGGAARGARPGRPAAVAIGSWGGGNPHPPISVATCAVPCVGMVNPEWMRERLAEGAGAVIILGCPADDCAYREGPRWTAARLRYRQNLLEQGVYWLAVAPGDRAALARLLTHLGTVQSEHHGAAPNRSGHGGWRSLYAVPTLGHSAMTLLPPLRSLASGLILLALVLGLALSLERPATAGSATEGAIRVVLHDVGQYAASSAQLSPEMQAKLPPGVTSQQLLGGERFPVNLRIEIDGDRVLERGYRPSGLRKEGAVYGVETVRLAPGRHQVTLQIMDDGATWHPAFSDSLDVGAGQVRILKYDEEQALFVPR
ncbi:MAG: hydrogenase iron-sulfur subunit [Ardenticatenaceae bacterium]|nr:hydrogenase iron-sulfur subunit [Ardenticatenaceae bacterium]